MKKEEMLEEIKKDEVFTALSKDLSEEEKKKVEQSLDAFVEGFALPLVDAFQQIADSPEAIEELKRQFAKSGKGVVNQE